ncbi:MAG TPA: tRNA lysidine(34) synthetase TilS, partial [Thermomicrobiales bacterium]|nr:tRNA lysidine(34) synthetase TilS [Thermomicrobiales bacterium]
MTPRRPTAAEKAPDLLAVVREAAAALAPDELAAPVLAGVSGGPDSVALLHLLWCWSREGGPGVAAVHVDHGLRAESGHDADWVRVLGAGWGIPVEVARVDVAALRDARRRGLEDAAREARYRAFAEVAAGQGARVVALAHHADDQAETVLLRLCRGAGLAGLRAMAPVRRDAAGGPAIWRPLLGVARADLAAYAAAHGLPALHDPTNADVTLRRN